MSKRTLSMLEVAFSALYAHKVRTALAVLGVMIGISSIIIVFAAGEGLSGIVLDEIESFGVDTIQVEIKMPSSKKGYASEQQSGMNLLMGAQVTTLKLDDMNDILKLPNVRDGYVILMGQEQVSYRGEAKRILVWGTSASFINIDQTEIEQGRFFSNSENNSLAQVVILGSDIKKKLFGDSDAIGRKIQVRKSQFRVIGVMEERGAIMGMNFDDFIYLPVKTLQKKVMGVDFVHNIIVKIDDVDKAGGIAEQMRVILRNNHNIPQPQEAQEGWSDTGKDDFRVMTMMEMLELMSSMTSTLTILLLVIVAISLVVGGVGVMNVMYVIVNERTGEIGLRKAVGARYSDLMLQFLFESISITMAGGVGGTLFGVLVSYLLAVGVAATGIDWAFVVPLKAFVTALIFSIVFGVLFGLYPARKAARMDPVTALQHRE